MNLAEWGRKVRHDVLAMDVWMMVMQSDDSSDGEGLEGLMT
jgi:hypothetical protein